MFNHQLLWGIHEEHQNFFNTSTINTGQDHQQHIQNTGI